MQHDMNLDAPFSLVLLSCIFRMIVFFVVKIYAFMQQSIKAVLKSRKMNVQVHFELVFNYKWQNKAFSSKWKKIVMKIWVNVMMKEAPFPKVTWRMHRILMWRKLPIKMADLI